MKKKIRFFASGICVAVLFFLCLSTVGNLVELKESRERYREFWEQPQEFDVWFMGTSHMYYCAQPMQLWKDYGITSYNLAAPSSNMSQTYWTLKSALQYSRPKLIVLDLYRVRDDNMLVDNDKKLHLGLDEIPFSGEKVRGVFDIFDNMTERSEYLWNFCVYHNRWDKLGERDFRPEYTPLKGAKLKAEIEDVDKYVLPPEDEMMTEDTLGHKYLRKILAECKEQKIPILLVSIPSCVGRGEQPGMNRVRLIADENDVPFLNISYLKDNPINYRVDMADPGHVNPSGSNKLTAYLGEYICQNYDISDKRSDEETAEQWDKDYERFREYIEEQIRQEKDLQNYLLWMQEDRYTCYVTGEKQFLKKKRVSEVLDNAAHLEKVSREQMAELVRKDDIRQAKGMVIAVFDNETGKMADVAVFNGITDRVFDQ